MIIDKALTWDQINFIIKNKKYHLFGRSKYVQTYYNYIKSKINTKYNTLRDKILITVFNCKFYVKNRKYSAIYDGKNMIKISENEFPYHIDDNIDHKLLWSTTDLTDVQIKRYLKQNFKNTKYVYYRNPPQQRSVPDVFHIHIFIRRF